MRFFIITIGAFLLFSCSDSTQGQKFKLKQEVLFEGLGTIEIPNDFIIDNYNKAQNQVPEIRFKNKTNSQFITIKRMNKIFDNLSVAKTMKEHEIKGTGAKVITTGLQDVNGRQFYVTESEVSIGGVATYKIDGATILNKEVLFIVFSCALEEKEKWSAEAKKVFFTLKIND